MNSLISVPQNSSIKYCIFIPKTLNKKPSLGQNVSIIEASDIVKMLV